MIAIDPGTTQSAWLIYLDGRLGDMGIADNRWIVQQLPMMAKFGYGPFVIEMVASYGKPVGVDTFETVYWIGRFSEAAGGADRVYRKDVKMHLCRSNKAKDPHVRQALIDRFGGVGGKAAAVGTKRKPGPLYGVKSHLWSALAVAVTYDDIGHRIGVNASQDVRTRDIA